MVWVTALSGCFTTALPQEERGDYLQCVRQRIESHLSESDGSLTIGAFSLRFVARLSA
jgi:hypothetical protein